MSCCTPAPDTPTRALGIAFVLNILLTIAQIIGGVLSGSLALIADALHNLNDAMSLLLALVVRRIAKRPADIERTFGYRRAETIGALVSTTALLLVGVYLVVEAIERYFNPEPISGPLVMLVAGIALFVDLATAALTHPVRNTNLNLRAAYIHNLADALGSLAVLAAGLVVYLYGFDWADLIAALLIAFYTMLQGYSLMKSSIRVLMASVPKEIDIAALKKMLSAEAGVDEVHHLHVWQLDEQRNALEAHIVVGDLSMVDVEKIKSSLKDNLEKHFGVSHSTLEFESLPCGVSKECL